MSLSVRGQSRASLLLPGGPLAPLYSAIHDEWRPDFKFGISRLDVSENDLMNKEMTAILKAFVLESSDNWLTYNGGATPSCSTSLLESLAGFLTNNFHVNGVLGPDQLVAGAGCSLLLEALARIICDPDDVILTPSPVWPIFHIILAKANVALSVVTSQDTSAGRDTTPSLQDQLAALNSILEWNEGTHLLWTAHIHQLKSSGKRPRAVLLSNPQNPLGRCYSSSFLRGILTFCQEHDLFLISDEVFALSHHRCVASSSPSNDFESVLSIDTQAEAQCDPGRVIALWSVSKDFGATATRLAVAVTPRENPLLKAALLSLAFSFRISSLADAFFSTFLTAKYTPDRLKISLESQGAVGLAEAYLQGNATRLGKAKSHLQGWCHSRDIRYLNTTFGHSLMVYLGNLIAGPCHEGTECGREQDFIEHLLSHHVILQSGRSGHFPFPGWFRLTFSRTQEYMETALTRLDGALNTWPKVPEAIST